MLGFFVAKKKKKEKRDRGILSNQYLVQNDQAKEDTNSDRQPDPALEIRERVEFDYFK